MKKRGQITVFIILVIALGLIFGMVYYLGGFKKTENAKAQVQSANQESDESGIVKSFAENCIKSSAEDALFGRIGPQGGFINPDGDARYAEEGVTASNSPIAPPKTLFDSKTVPFYYEASCEVPCTDGYWVEPVCTTTLNPTTGLEETTCSPPVRYWVCTEWTCTCTDSELPATTLDVGKIGEKLEHYVEAEFDACFDSDTFEDVGIEVIKPAGIAANAQVSLNEEDVVIKLNYPLTIKSGSTETKLESFIVILPIRIKALYESSRDFVEQVKEEVHTINGQHPDNEDLEDCRPEYNLAQSGDCQSYDKNRLTNVYIKTIPNQEGNQVVQFADYSTHEKTYLESYLFQFAVKTSNVDITGSCTG